jgi:hypothetical protein
MTATTALTAQNTMGVYDIHHIPPEFLARQIDACVDDIGVDVVKIGKQRPITPLNQEARLRPGSRHVGFRRHDRNSCQSTGNT